MTSWTDIFDLEERTDNTIFRIVLEINFSRKLQIRKISCKLGKSIDFKIEKGYHEKVYFLGDKISYTKSLIPLAEQTRAKPNSK